MGIAAIALGATVVSGIVGFAGQMMQASAASDQANYTAGVARNNQIIAQQNAERSAQAGAVQAQNRDMRTRAVVGAIEAGQGAGGIDVGSGSPVEVRRSAQQIGRLDTQTILDNAMMTSRSESAQAQSFGEEATLARMRGSAASTAGLVGGFGSLLGGATSFSDKWLRYQNVGVKF